MELTADETPKRKYQETGGWSAGAIAVKPRGKGPRCPVVWRPATAVLEHGAGSWEHRKHTRRNNDHSSPKLYFLKVLTDTRILAKPQAESTHRHAIATTITKTQGKGRVQHEAGEDVKYQGAGVRLPRTSCRNFCKLEDHKGYLSSAKHAPGNLEFYMQCKHPSKRRST